MIGRALNIGVTAKSINPSTRTSNITEQQLQNRSCSDDLTTHRMHRPPNRIHDCSNSIRSSGRTDNLGHFKKAGLCTSCNVSNYIRCVAVVMLLEQLEDRARMLKRLIPKNIIIRAAFVIPGCLIVVTRRLIKTREQSISKPVFFTDNKGSIGMCPYIIVVIQRILQCVTDKTAEKRDV